MIICRSVQLPVISLYTFTCLSSILSISFHFSTHFSSIFLISFHISTYFSSIFSISFHSSTYFSSYFKYLSTTQQHFLSYFPPVLFTIYAKKNENFTEMMYKISKTTVFIHIFQIYEEKKKN